MGSIVPWILDLDTTSSSTETSILLLTTRERTPGSNHMCLCERMGSSNVYLFERIKIIISADNRKQWSSPQSGTVLTYSKT